MMKITPGAMFGIAVPIAGEVRLIPLRNKYWKTSLHNNAKKNKNVVSNFRNRKNPNTGHKKA